MPTITNTESFNGAAERISRLGLQDLWEELAEVLTGFELRVHEGRDSNSGAVVRGRIDERFDQVGGWQKKATGGVEDPVALQPGGALPCLCALDEGAELAGDDLEGLCAGEEEG